MNRIVNVIGYKPTGKQTSLLSLKCVADSELPVDSYFLRKYGYFLVDNIQYTINEDLFFEKSTTEREIIDSITNNLILFQGTVGEYPIYQADGVDFETFPIIVDNIVDSSDARYISHGTITIYVKELESGVWKKYSEVDNMFLAEQNSRIYDLRLNENGHYEVKFGNNVFGKKLTRGDEVAAYYILSDGESGIISPNSIDGNKLFNFNSSRFNEIYNDVENASTTSTNINISNISLLTFSNPLNSSPISEAETVDEIRKNAPFLISSQIRLVTESDYEKFIMKSVSNLVSSVKVVDNGRFISEYIQYFYDICVDPNKSNAILMNQVNFADSCDFNNVNIFTVPFTTISSDGSYPDFLSESFKNLIFDLTEDKKMIGHEVIPRDPVYMAFDIGYTDGEVSSDISKSSKVVATRDRNNQISSEKLKKSIKDVIIDFLAFESNELGQKMDLTSLNSRILSIEGIRGVKTVNVDGGGDFNGISFVSWNPIYPGSDDSIVTQNTTLSFFKFPYLYSPNSIINNIDIIDE